MDASRMLIGLGIVIVLAGLAWPLLSKVGFGRMPGDIVVQRQNSRSISR